MKNEMVLMALKSEDLGEFYRYEEVQSAETYYDEYGSRWFAVVRLNLTAYKVIKKTPGGVWINCWGRGPHDRKFILMSAKKKWACPTKEAALESFIARKKRHRDILESRLAVVNEALEQAKKMKEKMNGELLHHRDPQAGSLPRDREGDAASPAADV